MNLTAEVQQVLTNFFDQESDQLSFLDERGDGHHFIVRITSNKFEGLSRIERSQLVYKLLNDFLTTNKIHALRMKLKTHNE